MGRGVVALLAVVAAVPWEHPDRWRVLGWSVAGAVVVTAAVVAIVHGFGLLGWSVPWSFDLWLGGVVLSLAVGATAWRYLRWRRWLLPVAVTLSVVAAAAMVNTDYGYYPTWQALTDPPPHSTTLRAVDADRAHDRYGGSDVLRGAPVEHGVVVEVPIPGRVSHFAARDAYVWLPPAFLTSPDLALPVVELLAGSPGSTLDWIRGGDAEATADAYASTHHGFAPIVVMPDENGTATADTECVDSRLGAAETYLAVDVPAYMRATFDAATGPSSLAVAGLSEGGECAAMLALTHPTEFRAFGDYSGLAAPSTASYDDPGPTIRDLFGGSEQRFAAHDPAQLLRWHRFPDTAGWFECGEHDPASVRDQALLAPLARRAGLDVVAGVVAGQGHDFTLWAQAFRQSLPFLVAHLGDRAA